MRSSTNRSGFTKKKWIWRSDDSRDHYHRRVRDDVRPLPLRTLFSHREKRPLHRHSTRGKNGGISVVARRQRQARHALGGGGQVELSPTEKRSRFRSIHHGNPGKWINALSLVLASRLGRHRQAGTDLPGSFKTFDLSRFDVRFVLVINGHRKDWLPPIQAALQKSLRPVVRTWNFAPTSVVVLNDELAVKHHLLPRT